MKTIQMVIITLLIITVVNCKETKKDAKEKTTEKSDDTIGETLTMVMTSKSNSGMNGEITFTQKEDELHMKAEFTGLDEGPHAIHLHQNADCSSNDGKSAGGHWNPTNEPHGKWGDEKGYHIKEI
ncbi:superoxide dismutase family protein [Zobellia sp.]|nr:superoxide dismutase family protein [Zobellia sp.]